MKVLISHSFAADDIFAMSLEKALSHVGLAPFNVREFGELLQLNRAEGPDRQDLDIAFRRAGYPRSTQERSDPNLLLKLVDVLRDMDTILILWSGEYARRYWTRIEWTSAMSMCKRIVVLKLDDTPLSPILTKAIARGSVPMIALNIDFKISTVVDTLLSMRDRDISMVGHLLGEVQDPRIGQVFVLLEHPAFGPLEISKYPVTRRVAAELGNNLFKSPHALNECDAHPLASITWYEAMDVCCRMSNGRTDYNFGLASEVEWEFAARAGELTGTGVPLDRVQRFGVFNQSSSSPVGTKEPNAWGLYDMVGNVAEWTSDAGQLNEINGWVQPVPKHDPSEGDDRAHMVRGGWFGQSGITSLSDRFAQRNEFAEAAVGMRIVRYPKVGSECQ